MSALPSATKEQSQQPVIVQDDKRLTMTCKSISLGSGSFSATGVMQLKSFSHSPHSNSTESVASFSDDSLDHAQQNLAVPDLATIKELKPSKVFIRTADLPHMEVAASQSRQSSFGELAEDQLVDYVHKRSATVPIAKIDHDPNECWVALDE